MKMISMYGMSIYLDQMILLTLMAYLRCIDNYKIDKNINTT